MKLLLDTNVVIWFLAGSPRLSEPARKLIEIDAATVTVSAVSIFEIATKAAIGKLAAPSNLVGTLVNAGLELMPVTPTHAEHVFTLPVHHRDPFDRLLIAQAQLEGLVVMTSDVALADYDIEHVAV